MKRFNALLAGSAVAAATALSAIAVSAAPAGSAQTAAETSKATATPAVRKAHGEGKRHGARRGACGSRAEARFERRVNLIEGLMEFTPAQQTAWTDLKTTMKSGQETIKKSCEARKEAGKPKTAIERFDRYEDAMATRLSVMRSVKPAFEKFYGTLTEKQQKAVDEMYTRKGRRG
ncbi:MAG: Spy/CpxP family protein refolding chaperone [Pseudomonadota bacterium]